MKKLLNVFMALLAVVALAGCFAVNEVKSIEFTAAPAASYEKDSKVKASNFSVVISFREGTDLSLKLNDSRLTVTGLDGDILDTKTHGLKTIHISYQGFSVSVSYNVEGQFLTYWKDNADDEMRTLTDFANNGIANTAQLAQFALLINETPADTAGKEYSLATGATFDLSAHEWTPIVDFQGTLNGDGATIKGLKMTDGTRDYSNKGFFGSVKGTVEVKDLTFDGVFINCVTDGLGETNKNYAAVIGNVLSGTETKIHNVVVQNSTLVGHGRIGALVGQANAKVTITNSQSIDNNFTAVNGYAAKSSDGNGDKVGGLVGQAQKEIYISGSLVDGIIVNGTRDLGGLIGYVSTTTTLVKNQVVDSSIQASVPGGMTPNKGTRNLGIFVGSVAHNVVIEFGVGENLNINNESSTFVNTNYGEISITGELFGCIRDDSVEDRFIIVNLGDKLYKITISISDALGSNERYTKLLTLVPQFEPFSNFLNSVANGTATVMPSTTLDGMIKIQEVTN